METQALPRTEGHKVLSKLERGKRYRIRHTAGSRTVTHTGLMVEGYHGELRLQTKVVRKPPLPMKPYLTNKTIRIFPNEIVSVDEVLFDPAEEVNHYIRINP